MGAHHDDMGCCRLVVVHWAAGDRHTGLELSEWNAHVYTHLSSRSVRHHLPSNDGPTRKLPLRSALLPSDLQPHNALAYR